MHRSLVFVPALSALFATPLIGQVKQSELDTAPPVVVRSQPTAGARNVDPSLNEIRVTFSKRMRPGAWSWVTAWEGSNATPVGKPEFTRDGKTCILAVKLEPNRTYGYWLNSKDSAKFQDAKGRKAVPYLLTFKTGPKALGPVAKKPAIRALDIKKGCRIVTDYGNTQVTVYSPTGKEIWKLENLFDPLDAELTPRGTLLVTEQGANHIREYDQDEKVIWEFGDVSRPLDADRLANGNTLIADPGNFRVIEVDAKGKIVWTFGRKEARSKDFKPYDADRLANGNTLITDYSGQRVIEVTPKGQVVWERRGCKFVCDADRLANGNTLITTRQPPQVIEVTPKGLIVWISPKLQLPWDADRLPDGTTMIAENFGVKIYGKNGKRIGKLKAEWASEVNVVGR